PLDWNDPDIVWLTGLHVAQGHRYFNKEAHQQLLWWSALPDLIATAEKEPAAKSPTTRKILQTFEREAEAAIAAAEKSGYRLDEMLQGATGAAAASTRSATAGESPATRAAHQSEPSDNPEAKPEEVESSTESRRPSK
ncbi:MAG: hypothetical protein WA476_09750, partial [Acidobacteriaceae bacterium]